MYKMVAMDMDGTLLTDNKDITERSKTAIKNASELGVKIVVCTGRIFASARVFAKLIGTSAPIVASNGAYIRENGMDKAVFKRTLKLDDIKALIKVSKEWGFYPHLFTHDTIFSEKLIFSSRNYDKWNKYIPENERVRIEIVEDLYRTAEFEKDNVLKVVVASEEIERINELKHNIREHFNLSVVSASIGNFEVMDKGISKGNAVKTLSDYYGIKPEEIICLGDSENDASMIEFAGLGVAMGNADEEIKTIADYVTDTNENDGVAKVIEKFILN